MACLFHSRFCVARLLPDLKLPDLQLLKPDLKLPDLQLLKPGLSGLKLPDLQLLKPDLQLPSLQWPDLKLPQQKLTGLKPFFFAKKFKNSTRILNMKIL